MTATLPEAQATAAVERYEPALSVNDIRESKLNPRKHFDKDALQELADGMKTKGQLQPVLVRPIADYPETYELAAGHRRYRAAKLAGMTTLKAVIRKMDDSDFLEVITFENLSREDLLPLEEADGYAALLKLPGYDVAAIAAKVGKSESYVHRRMALQKLCKEAQEALDNQLIEVGHAEVIARLAPDMQLQALVYCTDAYEIVTVKELRDYVARELLLQLKGVAWKLDDVTMPGGACSACPKRTGASPALFEDLARDDRCLDAACFHAKTEAQIERQLVQIEEKTGTPALKLSGFYVGTSKGVMGRSQYEPCKKSDKGALQGIYVEGPNVGKLEWVTREVRKTHSAPSDNTWQKEQKKREAKARVASAARLEALEMILARLPATIGRRELDVIAAGVQHRALHDAKRLMCKRQAWEVKKSKGGYGLDHEKPISEAFAKANDAALLQLIVELLLIDSTQVGTYGGDSPASHFQAALKAYDVDLAPIMARHQKAAKEKAKKPKAAKKRAGDVARARKKKAAHG